MSRRFGRNQKRAMRAKIAGLESLNEQQSKKISDLHDDINQANTVIERTAQVLGDHFATLPVQTRVVKEMQSSFQVSIFQPNRSYSIQGAVMHALSAMEIYVYQASLHVDELRSMIHFRYASESGQVGYGLSQQAWSRLREGQLQEMIEKQIAPEMARLLARGRNKRQPY